MARNVKDETMADRIVRLRKAQGLSTSKLAEEVGVKTSSVQQWESGKTQPRRAQRPGLARVLKVSELIVEFGEEAIHEELRSPKAQQIRRIIRLLTGLTKEQQSLLIDEIEATVQSNMQIAKELGSTVKEDR